MKSRVSIMRKQDRAWSQSRPTEHDLRKMRSSMYPGAMYKCQTYGHVVFLGVKDLCPTFLHISAKGEVRIQSWNNWESFEWLMSKWKKIC